MIGTECMFLEIQINASPASPDFRIWAPVLFRLQVSAGSDASYYVCVQYLHITCKNMCEHFQASDKPFDLCTILERTYLYVPAILELERIGV